MLVTLAITSAPLDQSARSPAVAPPSLLIHDFYCIISPPSVSFYTVQCYFMLSVNTCLYKVVCCWVIACRDNSRHAGISLGPTAQANVWDSWDCGCGGRPRWVVIEYKYFFTVVHKYKYFLLLHLKNTLVTFRFKKCKIRLKYLC